MPSIKMLLSEELNLWGKFMSPKPSIALQTKLCTYCIKDKLIVLLRSFNFRGASGDIPIKGNPCRILDWTF